MSEPFSGVRVRKRFEGKGHHEEADSSKRRGIGVQQSFEEREASHF